MYVPKGFSTFYPYFSIVHGVQSYFSNCSPCRVHWICRRCYIEQPPMNAAYLEKPLADIVLSLYDSCLQKYFPSINIWESAGPLYMILPQCLRSLWGADWGVLACGLVWTISTRGYVIYASIFIIVKVVPSNKTSKPLLIEVYFLPLVSDVSPCKGFSILVGVLYKSIFFTPCITFYWAIWTIAILFIVNLFRKFLIKE